MKISLGRKIDEVLDLCWRFRPDDWASWACFMSLVQYDRIAGQNKFARHSGSRKLFLYKISKVDWMSLVLRFGLRGVT